MTRPQPMRRDGMRRTQRATSVAIAGLALLLGLGAPQAWGQELAPDRVDISYGPDGQQKFDLWLPKVAPAPSPLLVIFHGGGYVGGDKAAHHPGLVLAKMLSAGIAVASANYRLAPGAIFPAQMLDGARMVQYVRMHHAELAVDPARIVLMGWSAGGAIALWVGLHGDLANPGAADPVLRQSTRVSCVVLHNAQATYDSRILASTFHARAFPHYLAAFFGASSDDALWNASFRQSEIEASPLTLVHAGEPPVLAYYDPHDGDGGPAGATFEYMHSAEQGVLLKDAARKVNAQVTVRAPGDYANGWAGFLDEAVRFVSTDCRR